MSNISERVSKKKIVNDFEANKNDISRIKGSSKEVKVDKWPSEELRELKK